MKAQIISTSGEKGKEIELPSCFSAKIREDIIQKYFEISKRIQPYAPYLEAGKRHSASGNIRHGRRKWKTAYGHGISRVPRKLFWRRGDHFYWVGAEIASTRGGRRAHPPKVEHFQNKKKMNKKEIQLAYQGMFSSTASLSYLLKRYSSLENEKIDINFPIIVESKILNLKAKEFYSALNKILGSLFEIAIKKKKIRAGKGKRRNRRYKENAGLLLVTGDKEEARLQGIQVKKIEELNAEDFYPLGRLTIYTEEAIKQLGEVA